MPARPATLRLLLVEDHAQDVRLLQEAFRETGFAVDLQACPDAEAAWKALQAAQRPADLPQAILLDLNLPGTSGHEFLARLNQDARLRALPVVVLTSSNHPSDVERARAGAASAYFLKPLTLAGYLTLAGELQTLWRNGLPRRPSAARPAGHRANP